LIKREFIVSPLFGVPIGIIHGWILCQLLGVRISGLDGAEILLMVIGFVGLVTGWFLAAIWLLLLVPDDFPDNRMRWRGLTGSLTPLTGGMTVFGTLGRADTFTAICIGGVLVSSIAAVALFRPKKSN